MAQKLGECNGHMWVYQTPHDLCAGCLNSQNLAMLNSLGKEYSNPKLGLKFVNLNDKFEN